jgi:hypothetical protein
MEAVATPAGNGRKFAAIGVLICALVAAAGYLAVPHLLNGSATSFSGPENVLPDDSATGGAVLEDVSGARQISEGEVVKWDAASGADAQNFALGDYSLSIERVAADGLYAPRLTVRAFGQELVLNGSATSETMPHQFSVVRLTSSGQLSVIFQSFSGGAHCCNHIQVAQIVGGKLSAVDLGSMDGDYIASPRDIDGDGVADFEFVDNEFLYAFAPYAMSYSPSQTVNVIDGKIIDVSRRKTFKRKDLLQLSDLGETCRNGGDGNTRNGACAAFIAVAARAGRLNEAWPVMVASYDASVDWEFPTGCRVALGRNGCPEGQQVTYHSYPEALLSFLKSRGYIARTWLPPEAFGAAVPDTDTDNGNDMAI